MDGWMGLSVGFVHDDCRGGGGRSPLPGAAFRCSGRASGTSCDRGRHDRPDDRSKCQRHKIAGAGSDVWVHLRIAGGGGGGGLLARCSSSSEFWSFISELRAGQQWTLFTGVPRVECGGNVLLLRV